jgi:NAD(P)-dependent dehydrogenase (short-subunit alcohol dehydrogenase family)
MGAFNGLRALVTGGASGIGLATARLLTAEGARVAVLDLAAAAPDSCAPYIQTDIGSDASVVAGVSEGDRRRRRY